MVKNVFTIPAGESFLRCLAQFALKGEHFAPLRAHDDPLAVSRMTIYLPTRRAVRALRVEFLNLMGNQAAFLPSIQPLGDEEENLDFLFFTDKSHNFVETIEPLERQIQLARLVRHWVDMMSAQTRELFRDEDIIIPASCAESLWLAREVGTLIDQMAIEEISLQELESLTPYRDEYAKWWQLTLDFLQIAMKSWPEILQQTGAQDTVSQRRLLLDARTEKLEQKAVDGPVIAAGSTGSIPATARFLKAVSELPQGALILPGLDKSSSEQVWNEITGNTHVPDQTGMDGRLNKRNSGCEDHPQYGMAKLLEIIGISRNAVTELGEKNIVRNNRSRLTQIALLPAEQTDQWQSLMDTFDDNALEEAMSGISIIDAPTERQEAMAIALALRKSIEKPDIHAALVTPDRNLARRVVSELKRFNLNIDDSGGIMLTNTANAVFIRLLVSIVTQPARTLTLASFVKHPFLSILPENIDAGLIGRLFEICLLREAREVPRPGEFTQAISAFFEEAGGKQYLPLMIRNINEEYRHYLAGLCKKLDQGFAPLANHTKEEAEIRDLFISLLEAIHLLSQDKDNSSRVFGGEAGKELAKLFDEIIVSENKGLYCRLDELPSVFDALVTGRIVHEAGNTHARISILGPLEARLQPIDYVILGGLNEGTWPTSPNSGFFLNRPMKMAINLATPERRVGLAAHDFEQLMGCFQVYLTRSQRANNAPTVPSRWLQRLTAVCGKKITDEMQCRGEEFLVLANLIDNSVISSNPSVSSRRGQRPCPAPPVKYRPKRLSITEIEAWIRDPYAIYAKHILKLNPLSDIGIINESLLRGSILHDAVAEFIQNTIDPFDKNAKCALVSIIENHIQINKIPPHMKALWMPRLQEIAQSFVEFERKNLSMIRKSYCEINGRIDIGNTGFELYGRADRINIMENEKLSILDYKTGMEPSTAMARTLSPQLPLEGAIAMAGGFDAIKPCALFSLEYVRLRPHGDLKSETVNNDKLSAEELAHRALAQLKSLVIAYNNPEKGYLSRFAVMQEEKLDGTYDHLARAREWLWAGNMKTMEKG